MRTPKLFRLAALLACMGLMSCAGSNMSDMSSSLWSSLGGVDAVSKLSHSFGKQLAGNAALSQKLGMQGIEQAQRGLYNSIGQAAGYKIDKGSDLQSVLQSKNLDKSNVDAVGNSLKSAARSEGLSSSQMALLTGMWEPIAKKLD